MKNIELQAAFELEINKIDSNLEKPKSVDIEYWLNQGLERFYKTRYSGLNYKNLGFEQDQKRIDDLRTLIRTKVFELDEESWYLNQENSARFTLSPGSFINLESVPRDKVYTAANNVFYVRIPHKYVFLLGDSTAIVPTKEPHTLCAKRDDYGDIIPIVNDVIESNIETIDSQLRNSLSEHNMKYSNARPLRVMYDNAIVLITDGNYRINSYQLIYLRKPNNIDIHNNPYDEYTDMPEHTHSEIVKLAVQMYLENQKDNRYNTYQNEVTQME